MVGLRRLPTMCPGDARHLAASEDGYFGSELNEYETVMYAEAVSLMTIDKCTFCADRCKRRPAAGQWWPFHTRAGARVFGELTT